MAEALSPAQVLAAIPHREPFRFVDEILEVSTSRAKGSFHFPRDAWFYRGHFPGHPVTPGVLLTECMLQTGLLPLGIFLMHQENPTLAPERLITAVTDAESDYHRPVYPGERVICSAEKIFWRRGKIRARLELRSESGDLLVSGSAAGMGVTGL